MFLPEFVGWFKTLLTSGVDPDKGIPEFFFFTFFNTVRQGMFNIFVTFSGSNAWILMACLAGWYL